MNLKRLFRAKAQAITREGRIKITENLAYEPETETLWVGHGEERVTMTDGMVTVDLPEKVVTAKLQQQLPGSWLQDGRFWEWRTGDRHQEETEARREIYEREAELGWGGRPSEEKPADEYVMVIEPEEGISQIYQVPRGKGVQLAREHFPEKDTVCVEPGKTDHDRMMRRGRVKIFAGADPTLWSPLTWKSVVMAVEMYHRDERAHDEEIHRQGETQRKAELESIPYPTRLLDSTRWEADLENEASTIKSPDAGSEQ